jgi:hypothetical protein
MNFDRDDGTEPVTTTVEVVSDSGKRVAELLENRDSERQAIADRVSFLFPRPETCEWDIREIAYDRRRRAQAS